jgi:hypothetical protein
MHDPSVTSATSSKRMGVSLDAEHRSVSASAPDAGALAQRAIDPDGKEGYRRLVRRMSTEGLTARVDPVDSASAILVRPSPRGSLGAGRVRRALLDEAVAAGALVRDRHGICHVADPSALAAEQPEQAARTADPPRINDAESPLAWLHGRTGVDGERLIGDAAFLAGERFRRDVTQAAMLPSVTTNWSRMEAATSRTSPRDPATASDTVIAARQRVRAAFQVLGRDMGHFVLDVCGFLVPLQQAELQRRWPARSGKLVLKLALARLAAHYGISDTATGRRHAMAEDRIVAWHDAPERASMEAWLHAADPAASAPAP